MGRMTPPRRDPIERPCEICGEIMLLGGRGRKPSKTRYCSYRCVALGRTVIPTMTPLDRDVAVYVAGLFDGEGCIVIYDRGYGGRPQLRATITNTHEGVIDWLRERVARGTVITKHYTKPEQAHFKDSYTWQVYGQNAVFFLRQILPYLVVKRARALEAIASQEVQRVE